MIETDLGKRQEAMLQENSKRDGIIRTAIAEYAGRFYPPHDRTVPGAGNWLQPFDAQYEVRDALTQKTFLLIDCRTTPPCELSNSIRQQLEAHVDRRHGKTLAFSLCGRL